MNKKLKAIGAAALAAAMCASLSGCKSDEEKFMEALESLDKEIANEIQNAYGSKSSQSTSSEPELKEYDPFENIEVKFEGISPNIKASFTGYSYNSPVTYELSKKTGLENGDTITLNAELLPSKVDSYVLTSDSKEYKVSDMASYIMKISDLTDAEFQKLDYKLRDGFQNEIISHFGGGEGSTVNTLDFLGNINLTKDNRNYRLYFVYKANVTFANAGETADFIFAAYYSTIYRDKDGTLIFDGGIPYASDCGDLSLSMRGYYVKGSYASIDSLNSALASFGAERESNVKDTV